jgi:hypothetical protein
MEVTVLDASGDPIVGSGPAEYQWIESLNEWKLLWSNITAADRLPSIVETSTEVTVNKKIITNDTIIHKVTGTYGWEDLQGKLDSRSSGNGDPTWATFLGGIQCWRFSPTIEQSAYVSYHIPHSYLANSNLYMHLHWSTADNVAGNIVIGFEYTVANGYGRGTFQSPITTKLTVANDGPYKHHISEVDLANSISGVNIEVDSIIMMRVFRDATSAADTYPNGVFLIQSDLHMQVDRLSTKNKNYPFYS